MPDLLSEQIHELRAWIGSYLDDGMMLTPEAIETFDAMLGSFETQARELEAPRAAPAGLATVIAGAEEEARACDALARRLAETNALLKARADGKVVLFPGAARRGDVSVEAALAMVRQIVVDDGGAA